MPNERRRLLITLGLGSIAAALIALAPGQAAARSGGAPLRIFLSTDVGCEIDDQWPILHLLTDRRFDVRVIASAHAPPDAIPAPPAINSAATLRHIVQDRLRLGRKPRIVAGSNVPLASATSPRPSAAVDALLRMSRGFGRKKRLTVLVTGAATDVASALIRDPSLADRIEIVAMGFRSFDSGDEFNINNDPEAWRVILGSPVPLTVGDQAVTTKRLSLTRDEAHAVLQPLGPVGAWLMRDYDVWYDKVTRSFQNPGRPAGPPSWPIWDEVVVAHLLGMTRFEDRPRPQLAADKKLVAGGQGTIRWITDLDRQAVFGAFGTSVARYVGSRTLVDRPCVTVAREANACWRNAR